MNNHPAFLIHAFLFLIEVNLEVLEWSFLHVIFFFLWLYFPNQLGLPEKYGNYFEFQMENRYCIKCGYNKSSLSQTQILLRVLYFYLLICQP